MKGLLRCIEGAFAGAFLGAVFGFFIGGELWTVARLLGIVPWNQQGGDILGLACGLAGIPIGAVVGCCWGYRRWLDEKYSLTQKYPPEGTA